jgi:hypothetical protein
MALRTRLQAFAAGCLLLAAACSDHTEPPAPDTRPEPSEQAALQAAPGDPIGLGRKVAGFGGFYLDAQEKPVVYLRGPAQRADAERALAPFLTAQGLAVSELRVLAARFDWDQLETWSTLVSAQVLALPGGVFVDADESTNRVLVGVERGASARVRSALARLGLPTDAVTIQETEPIRLLATLRGRVRPVMGGLQINFPDVNGFICSLGFNALRSGQRSFITASHCTNRQGGVENTAYYQPVQSSTSPRIATEVSDPAYPQSKPGCPPGRRCRFSDAARASYTSGTTYSLGKIAKTSGANNGSLTITGSFSITAEGAASVGQSVDKIGRTTGWTRGKVSGTCVNANINGTDITQLCQTVVSAGAAGGDSGAPVFRVISGSNVRLVGILWGGGEGLYVYSPIANIERELGALTTF